MYPAAVRALTGEIFGKSRSALLGAAVLTPAAWLLARGYMRHVTGMGPTFGAPIGFLLLVVIAMQLASVFAYVDLTAGGRSSGFPKHIQLLPVPTWLLALVPIIVGSLFISAFVLLWLHFVSEVEFEWAQQLILVGAVTAMMCWIQAMSWELLPQRYLRLVLLLLVVITIILSVVSALAEEPDLLFGKERGAIGLLIMTAAGYGLAYLAVVRARRGETLNLGAVLKHLSSVPKSSLRHAPLPAFCDGVSAQDWFEWRVYGRVLPWFVIIIGAGPVASVAFERMRHAPSIALSTLLLVVFFGLVSPMMGAAYLSKDLTRRIHMGTFAATRPLSDLEFAFAKLRLSVRSYSLSVAILFSVIGVLVVTSSNNVALHALWSRLMAQLGSTGLSVGVVLLLLGVMSAASWAASAAFMSVQLAYEAVDRKKHGWKISIGVVAIFLFCLAVVRWTYEARRSALLWLQSAHLQVMIPAVLLTGLALCLVPQFRRLAALGELKALSAAFLAATVAGLLLLSQLPLLFGYRWAMSWGLVSLSLLTFMPFLLVPVLVRMSRHR